MKTIKKVVNEDTLELEEVIIEEFSQNKDEDLENYRIAVLQALGCEPEEFSNAYKKYKDAEKEFKRIYDPFKSKLLSLYRDNCEKPLPQAIMIDGVKLTYVSPSTRTSIDSKKLKEEEPDIARRFTKITSVDATIRLN